MSQFVFDLQLFNDYNVVNLKGTVNNVEAGDTFTVDNVAYTVLSVDTNAGEITAAFTGTAANLGKKITVSDNKSIEGITSYSTDTTTVDSSITTKYNYSLNIGTNAITVTVNGSDIEKVVDASNNTLTATEGKYTVGGTDFTLSLDNGIPSANYDSSTAVDATLASTTYSFTVGTKPVEVTVVNGAITNVTVNNEAQDAAAGTYTVDDKSIQLSYADSKLNAQTADILSVSSSNLSNSASYTISGTTVTVDANGILSTDKATIEGQEAILTYSDETKKVTAAYDVTSTPTANTIKSYTLKIDDSTSAVVTINQSTGTITVNDGTNDISIENGTYTVGDYKLTLTVENNALTKADAVKTSSTSNLTTAETFEVKIGNDSQTVTIANGALTDDQKSITVGSNTVTLDYSNGTLSASYSDNETLTPTANTVSIADALTNGATITVAFRIGGSEDSNGTCVFTYQAVPADR